VGEGKAVEEDKIHRRDQEGAEKNVPMSRWKSLEEGAIGILASARPPSLARPSHGYLSAIEVYRPSLPCISRCGVLSCTTPCPLGHDPCPRNYVGTKTIRNTRDRLGRQWASMFPWAPESGRPCSTPGGLESESNGGERGLTIRGPSQDVGG
jgi:hypothetical protein